MRNLYVSLFLIAIFSIKLNAQWVTIPDTNFVSFLQQNYPQCMSGNQMDTTCSSIVNETQLACNNKSIFNMEGIQYFSNLIGLNCSYNNLSILSILPNSLQFLYCQNNQLLTLPTLPNNLIELVCNDNQISILPALPSTLSYFLCFNNQLTALPQLPLSLNKLACYNNQLNSIPNLPNGLIDLNCGNNQLTTFPILPNSLEMLTCHNNQINSIPNIPTSLKNFYAVNNALSSLPNLSDSLIFLRCASNQLTSLPPLPNSLIFLNCDQNLISQLPALPTSLKELTCSFNLLSNLPALPNSLESLSCGNNQITGLPSLPPILELLHARNNLISSLPYLPSSLKSMYVQSNLLTSIPDRPDTLSYLHIYNNPSLTCLPQLKKVTNFWFYNTGVNCLPNYGNITYSSPQLSSLPLCGIFNPYGCDVFWNISGKVFSDNNLNCIADVNEFKLKNIKLQLFENGTLIQQVFSGTEGLYSFDTDTGTFQTTVDTTDLPIMVTCPTSGMHISSLTSLDSLDYNMDFAMQCKPGFDVGVKNIIRKAGRFFPGNNATLKIGAGDLANFYGFQCAAGISGSIVIDITGPVTFVSEAPGALVPTFAGNILTYNITDFGIVNFNSDFLFILATDTTAQAGDQICFTVNVTPTSGDNNVLNNTLQHCFTVVNSFDPNAKEVFPSENVSLNQEWLTYTLHFQNTGNAPAQNIYIIDTLDQNLIPSSFTLLTYSHELMTQVFDNVVKFNFPNINLPDSTNDEPNSHGFVQYKIKLNSGLPFGTIVSNTAYNFFDFNPPVATNSVQISLGTVGIIEKNPVIDFNVYPVPTTGEASISFTLEKPVEVKIELYNTLGQLVKTITRKKFPSSKNQINFTTENLFKGVYYIKLSVDENVAVKRLVKM